MLKKLLLLITFSFILVSCNIMNNTSYLVETLEEVILIDDIFDDESKISLNKQYFEDFLSELNALKYKKYRGDVKTIGTSKIILFYTKEVIEIDQYRTLVYDREDYGQKELKVFYRMQYSEDLNSLIYTYIEK